MKKFITGTIEAFQHGVIHATRHKVRRWVAVLALWLVALSMPVLAVLVVVTAPAGYMVTAWIYFATFLVNGCTFVMVSMSLIHTFSADEYRQETANIYRSIYEGTAR